LSGIKKNQAKDKDTGGGFPRLSKGGVGNPLKLFGGDLQSMMEG
jgi:hypothetical protein